MAPRHGLPLFIPRSLQPSCSSSISPSRLLCVDQAFPSLCSSPSLLSPLAPFLCFCTVPIISSFHPSLSSVHICLPSLCSPPPPFWLQWFSSHPSSCSSLPPPSLILITFSSAAHPYFLGSPPFLHLHNLLNLPLFPFLLSFSCSSHQSFILCPLLADLSWLPFILCTSICHFQCSVCINPGHSIQDCLNSAHISVG